MGREGGGLCMSNSVNSLGREVGVGSKFRVHKPAVGHSFLPLPTRACPSIARPTDPSNTSKTESRGETLSASAALRGSALEAAQRWRERGKLGRNRRAQGRETRVLHALCGGYPLVARRGPSLRRQARA